MGYAFRCDACSAFKDGVPEMTINTETKTKIGPTGGIHYTFAEHYYLCLECAERFAGQFLHLEKKAN